MGRPGGGAPVNVRLVPGIPIVSFPNEWDIVPFEWVVGNLVVVVVVSSVVATLVSIALAGRGPSDVPDPGSGQAGR